MTTKTFAHLPEKIETSEHEAVVPMRIHTTILLEVLRGAQEFPHG